MNWHHFDGGHFTRPVRCESQALESAKLDQTIDLFAVHQYECLWLNQATRVHPNRMHFRCVFEIKIFSLSEERQGEPVSLSLYERANRDREVYQLSVKEMRNVIHSKSRSLIIN